MKQNLTFKNLLRRVQSCASVLAAMAAVAQFGTTLHAATFTWGTTTTPSSWASQGNWTTGTLPTTNTDTADFSQLDLTADTTVTLDGNQSIGSLIFGDTATGTVGSWIVSTGAVVNATLTLGGAPSSITLNGLGSGKVVQINTSLAGTNPVVVTGTGTLQFGAVNTYTNTTTLNSGVTLQANLGATVGNGTGQIIFNGGTLVNGYGANNSWTLGNPLNVPTGQTGTINMGNRLVINNPGALLTGGGTLNLNVQTTVTRDDEKADWSGFTGTVNLLGSGPIRFFINGGAFSGIPNGTLNVDGSVSVQFNDNSGGNTFRFGALSGTNASANIGNTSAGGVPTLLVGALSTSTTFAGQVQGGTVFTKQGNGTLTLPANNPYTGATLVSTGAIYGVTGGSISNSTITVGTNATFGVQVASANGQWTGTNLVLRNPSSLAFNFGTVAPSTTTAPLKLLGAITATNTVINIYGGAGWVVGGVYPLAKYTGPFVGNGFASFSLGTLPLRVSGVLVNDSANNQISFQVTAVNEPLQWAVGNANWDLTTANWKDAAGTVATYQEQIGLGDPVVFGDLATGTTPISVTLNTNVTPGGVTFSNISKAYTLTGLGSILGTTPITKTGAGLVILANTNTTTGALNLSGGTLNFSSFTNIGNGTAINFGGGTLQFAAGNTSDISSRTVTINAGGAGIDTGVNNLAFNNRLGNGGAGGLTKLGAGVLTLNTNNTFSGITTISAGTLALGASGSLSNSPAIVVGSSASFDVSAPGGLTLNGPAGQSLQGYGTVVGSVTSVAGAKLVPGTNGVVGTLTFANDLTLNGGTFTFDVGSSSHDLIVVGGYLNLNGSVSGTVQINALNLLPINSTNRLFQYPQGQLSGGGVGTLSVAVSGAAQSGRLLQLDNSVDGAISLVVLAAPAHNLTWVGDGGANAWDTTSPNWTGVANVFSDGDNASFTDAGALNSPVNISPLAVTPNSVTVNATSDYTFTGAKITGPATLTKSGSGKLTLNNQGNDYGPTVINAGTLQIGDGGTGGTSIGSGNVTNNASLVFNQPDNSMVTGDISGTGSLNKQGGGTLTLLGNNTYGGATTVDSGVLQVGNGGPFGTLAPAPVTLVNAATLDLNHTGVYALANGISGDGTVKFDGAAVVTFGGVNSYLENTYINSGLVKLAGANVIPSGGSTTGWLILDGGAAAGALDLNGFNQTVNALSGLGGAVQGQIFNNGSGTSKLTINTIATTTYAGLILDNTNGGSGHVALTINGDGSGNNSLTLSGANSYTGGAYIDGATVVLGGSIGTIGQLAIGTGPVTLTNGGSLQMNGYGSATQSGNFVNSILVPAGTTGSLLTVGRGAYTGSVTVHGTLNLTTSYVRSQPAGDWSGSDGQINIKAGTLGGDVYLNNAGNINFGTAAIDLGAGVHMYNSANTVAAGNIITIGELTGSGTISDTTAGTAGRVTTYQVGGRNSDATFSGTIANQTRITAVNKVGTGSWTLNGTDSYTGATTVSGGSLIVGPSAFMTASTPITVSSGAVFDVSSYNGLTMSANQTLTGSGVVTGAVTTVSSDTISPGVGTAAGTLSFSNSVTETGPGVTNNFNLSSDPTGLSKSNSLVVINGDLTLTGLNVVTINPLSGILGAGTYTLFKYSGNLVNEGGVVSPGTTLENNLAGGGAFALGSDVALTFSNAPGAVVMIVKPIGQNLVWQGGITGTVTNNWDLASSTNWFAGGTVVTNFHNYDKVTFDDSATNLNAILAGTLAPGSITVNSSNSYTFSGAGKISGSTGLSKSGTNVLTIGNTTANDYDGQVTINAGTLKMGIASALGSTNGPTVISGGATLDVNGYAPGLESVTVQGAGVGGNGAIINNGAAMVNLGFNANVTLAGDTTFGGTNRWDIFNGSLTGNSHKLTKVGPGYIVFTGLGEIGVANIEVQQGYFTFIGNTTMGAPGNTLSLWPGGRIDFYASTITNSKVVMMTNAIISTSNGTNYFAGPITMDQTNRFLVGTPLILSGALGGAGSLLKDGASELTLNVANTYSGTTTLSNGVTTLAAGGSIANSPIIDVLTGAVLNVAAKPSGLLTLASGQTLAGRGTVYGSVTVPAGASIAPGEAGVIGALTVSNTLTLQGNTLVDVSGATSDQIVATNIVLGGTLTLANAGSYTAGSSYKLFSGNLSGYFSGIVPSIPGPGLGWNTNSLAGSGILSVIATVNLNPTNLTAKVSGNQLTLSWPADHTGWYLQTNSAGLNQPNQWYNWPNSQTTSSIVFTLDPSKPAVFYRMVYTNTP